METTQIIILVVVLLVVAAIAAALVAQARKRKRLQSTFGPEYDRTVESSGRRRDAERELAEREERRRQLDIRPLPEQDRQMFSERWRSTQADFVDHPETAVRQADELVAEVMSRRGYPVGDFEQMSRDVSVDHANVVHEYRAAHDISELNDRKQASTEQLRQAMVHYRALFTDLLSAGDGSTGDGSRGSRADVRDDRHSDGERSTHTVSGDERSTHTLSGDERSTHTVGSDERSTHMVGSDERSTYADGGHGHGHVGSSDYTEDGPRRADEFSPASSGDRSTSEDTERRHTSEHVDVDRRSSGPIATSHAEGVRVEPGGLHRNHLEDGDRPRA